MAKKAPYFTEDELKLIHSAAHTVWNDIGYDLLQAVADEKGKHINAVTISRANVVEVVCDASRLEEQLRRSGHKELAEKVSNCIGIQKWVKPAFTYTRYGM